MWATAVSTIKIGLISLILSLLAAAPAAAISSVSLQWRGNGGDLTIGSTPGVLPPSPQIVDIVLTVDGNTVIGVFWSVEYDPTELAVVSTHEISPVNLPGMGNVFIPQAVGTTTTTGGTLGGIIGNFDERVDPISATGLETGNTRTLGSITFNVIGRSTDGVADATVVIQQNGIDAISDSSGTRCIGVLPRNDCPYTFGSLFVPEPTTSALVALGLGLGVFYSRRR